MKMRRRLRQLKRLERHLDRLFAVLYIMIIALAVWTWWLVDHGQVHL